MAYIPASAGKHGIKATDNYDMVKTNNVDTLSRTYSWTGEYRVNAYQGEGVPTLAEFKGYTLATVANLTYHLGDQHFFTCKPFFILFSQQQNQS